MRVLSFSRMWAKLDGDTLTTFRFERKDRDWEVGEQVQMVFKARSPQRRVLGVAEIVDKTPRWVMNHPPGLGYAGYFNTPLVTEEEAVADGFSSREEMVKFIRKERRMLCVIKPLNKLTVRWLTRVSN